MRKNRALSCLILTIAALCTTLACAAPLHAAGAPVRGTYSRAREYEYDVVESFYVEVPAVPGEADGEATKIAVSLHRPANADDNVCYVPQHDSLPGKEIPLAKRDELLKQGPDGRFYRGTTFFIPRCDEKFNSRKLPVIMDATPYGRTVACDTKYVPYGYAYLSIDMRGTSASYGFQNGDFTPAMVADIKYIIDEWLPAQPWFDAQKGVGMQGTSYLAGVQVMAAGLAPKNLKAIIPHVGNFDFYDLNYPGGIYNPEGWSVKRPWAMGLNTDGSWTRDIGTCVDDDVFGLKKAAAITEHAKSKHRFMMFGGDWSYTQKGGAVVADFRDFNDFKQLARDSYCDVTGNRVFIECSAQKNIANVTIPMYEWAGWGDAYVNHQLIELYSAASSADSKIVIGNWNHGGDRTNRTVLPGEELRWFDKYLRGMATGAEDLERVYYYTKNAPDGTEWRGAEGFPLKEQKITRLYLINRATETAPDAKNDGTLSTAPRNARNVTYTVDYAEDMVWQDTPENYSPSARTSYWDLDRTAGVDNKSVVYTSPILYRDTQMTGFPVAHLSISSTARNAYFFVFIEDYDPKTNTSTYVTDGKLNAQMRKLGSHPAYDLMGIPYHPSNEADLAELVPGEVATLDIALYPTSYVFKTGHRIRACIANAFDNDVFPTPRAWLDAAAKDGAPEVTIHQTDENPSYIDIPIIGASGLPLPALPTTAEDCCM